jgi:hypothetical protein
MIASISYIFFSERDGPSVSTHTVPGVAGRWLLAGSDWECVIGSAGVPVGATQCRRNELPIANSQ